MASCKNLHWSVVCCQFFIEKWYQIHRVLFLHFGSWYIQSHCNILFLNSRYISCIMGRQPCMQVMYVPKKTLLTGGPNPFWGRYDSERSWSIKQISRQWQNWVCLALRRQDWGNSYLQYVRDNYEQIRARSFAEGQSRKARCSNCRF